MELFITYGRVAFPECKYFGFDSNLAQQKKSCFKRETCPDNVVCQKDYRGVCDLPADICPTPRCRGNRRTTCITEYCPEFSQKGEWRCSLGKLPQEAKSVFEEKLAKEPVFSDEMYTLLSEEGLGLSAPVSTSERRIRHQFLLDKFRSLKKTCLEADYEINDFQFIPLMIECQQLADEIREGEVKYVQQSSFSELFPVSKGVTDSIVSVPDESEGRWVSLDEAAKIRNVKKKTLEKYREQGVTNSDELSGKDSHDFLWKREKKKGRNAATKYFIPRGYKPVNPDGD